MLVIPAIDIRAGSCVRWTKGKPETEVVYSRDPVEVALKWKKLGASRLHIVDLDGALSGQPHHLGLAGEIKAKTGLIVQFGGGLREPTQVRKAFELGVERVILGTVMLEHAGWIKEIMKEFSGHLIVALDAYNGKVAIEGWTKETGVTVEDYVKQIESLGIREVIFTDINKDGMLSGPNIESTQKLAASTWMKIYASGGISSLEDIKKLSAIPNLAGCIIGRALYTGALELDKAIAATK